MGEYIKGFYLGECERKEQVVEAIHKWIIEDVIDDIVTDRQLWLDNVQFTKSRVFITNYKTKQEYKIDPYENLLSNKNVVIVFDMYGAADVIPISELNRTYKNEKGEKYYWQLITPLQGFDLYE